MEIVNRVSDKIVQIMLGALDGQILGYVSPNETQSLIMPVGMHLLVTKLYPIDVSEGDGKEGSHRLFQIEEGKTYGWTITDEELNSSEPSKQVAVIRVTNHTQVIYKIYSGEHPLQHSTDSGAGIPRLDTKSFSVWEGYHYIKIENAENLSAEPYLEEIDMKDGMLIDIDISDNGITVYTPSVVASAGTDMTAVVGETVYLSGSAVSNEEYWVNYLWQFVSRPEGSQADLFNRETSTPYFQADVAGSFVVSLVGNDGQQDSKPDEILITVKLANVPKSISFHDTDSSAGYIGGTLRTVRAHNETEVLFYNIYFTDSTGGKLSLVHNLQPTGHDLNFNIANGTQIRQGATRLAVFSVTVQGEADPPADVAIVDEKPPEVKASGIVFTDYDGTAGQIGGPLIIKKADNESKITHYRLYWGDTPHTNLGEIALLPKTGEDLLYSFSANSSIPFTAQHFIVTTVNQNGEMATGISLQIEDEVFGN
jgi:hypothetical protein